MNHQVMDELPARQLHVVHVAGATRVRIHGGAGSRSFSFGPGTVAGATDIIVSVDLELICSDGAAAVLSPGVGAAASWTPVSCAEEPGRRWWELVPGHAPDDTLVLRDDEGWLTTDSVEYASPLLADMGLIRYRHWLLATGRFVRRVDDTGLTGLSFAAVGALSQA